MCKLGHLADILVQVEISVTHTYINWCCSAFRRRQANLPDQLGGDCSKFHIQTLQIGTTPSTLGRCLRKPGIATGPVYYTPETLHINPIRLGRASDIPGSGRSLLVLVKWAQLQKLCLTVYHCLNRMENTQAGWRSVLQT